MGMLLAQETTTAAVQADSPYRWILLGAAVVIGVLLLLSYLTRAGTIARATTKEALRQPVFLLLLTVGVVVIGANYYVPFFSLGEDTKMFIDCGLATILICSLLLAVWTASMSVADEIEGKTAMTLLSKSITPRQFVVGKYLGTTQSELIMILIMGAIFFVLTYFKFGYDQRESGKEQPQPWIWADVMGMQLPTPEPERLSVASKILPALSLIFMEVAVMTAVSVAISTRLSMLMNLVTCFTIFVVGHLTPVLVASTFQTLPPVRLLAQVAATVLPSLETFNMSAAVSTGKDIPLDYIALSGVYALAYIGAAVLLGFIMFEDRDLA